MKKIMDLTQNGATSVYLSAAALYALIATVTYMVWH